MHYANWQIRVFFNDRALQVYHAGYIAGQSHCFDAKSTKGVGSSKRAGSHHTKVHDQHGAGNFHNTTGISSDHNEIALALALAGAANHSILHDARDVHHLPDVKHAFDTYLSKIKEAKNRTAHHGRDRQLGPPHGLLQDAGNTTSPRLRHKAGDAASSIVADSDHLEPNTGASPQLPRALAGEPAALTVATAAHERALLEARAARHAALQKVRDFRKEPILFHQNDKRDFECDVGCKEASPPAPARHAPRPSSARLPRRSRAARGAAWLGTKQHALLRRSLPS